MGVTQESNEQTQAMIAHIAPFGLWLALMHFLDVPQLTPAMAYALRSAICLAALLILRPWRWYEGPKLKHIPLAVAAGIVVLALWVFGESPWCPEAIRDLYIRWGVRPFGELREPIESTPYAPSVCGWPLTLVRIGGSAFVIGVIEEFFWRGFVYRWGIRGKFLTIGLGELDLRVFLVVALVFGLEHHEWLAGTLCGLIYGWIILRTRNLWTGIVAHALTNFLLGFYIVATGSYQFW